MKNIKDNNIKEALKKIGVYLNKSKIAFVSLMLMFVIASYINYEYNPEREENLGQTIYVNGKDTSLSDINIYEEVDIYENEAVFNYEKANETTSTDDIITINNESETIAVFKYDRDNMFSELSESYRDIIESEQTSVDMVNEYQKKLDDLLTNKNLIKMVENIIRSEGIDNVVIIPSSGNYNVVIKSSDEIDSSDIAKITSLIVDRFSVSADKVTVTIEK